MQTTNTTVVDNIHPLYTSLDTHNVTSVGASRSVVVAVTVPVMLIVLAIILGIPLFVLLKRKLNFKEGSRDVVTELYQSPSTMANPVYGGASMQLCV